MTTWLRRQLEGLGEVNRNDPVLKRALAALRMDDELTVRYQLDALPATS